MKKSIIAGAGALLIGPFLVLGAPTAHATGECYYYASQGDDGGMQQCLLQWCGQFLPNPEQNQAAFIKCTTDVGTKPPASADVPAQDPPKLDCDLASNWSNPDCPH
jgi:hypothetical protein